MSDKIKVEEMTCINNIDIILPLLNFESEDTFYHLQIIKRKKEHRELGSNSMIVKTYYIKSTEHLTNVLPEIIAISDFHNARACINLSRRSFEKVAYQMLMKITGQIMNKDFKSVRKAYESVCGMHSAESEKKWIIDIDVKDEKLISIIANTIKNCEPDRRQSKVIATIPTKNGIHLITSPFNIAEFREFHSDIEVHKDNPTILYISLRT